MKRDFNTWLSTMKDSIDTWKYYTDFEKVFNNTDSIKVELNILNSLIGSKNIKNDFLALVKQYPNILKAVPILIAKRETEIKINDTNAELVFNFKNPNYGLDDYANFMEKTGLFDLISNHIIGSLYDYVMGVETGMDTNARKNRTGDAMEDLVEGYILKEGFVNGVSYFKEMYKSDVEKTFKINLSKISNNGKTEKRFDFVISKGNTIYAIECNFYGSSGSKLNETARSYKNLAIESKGIKNFVFIWITDGVGWFDAKHNLEETFDILDNLYNLNDLENGTLKSVIK